MIVLLRLIAGAAYVAAYVYGAFFCDDLENAKAIFLTFLSVAVIRVLVVSLQVANEVER